MDQNRRRGAEGGEGGGARGVEGAGRGGEEGVDRMFDVWEEQDRFSFEDSERFEEVSLKKRCRGFGLFRTGSILEKKISVPGPVQGFKRETFHSLFISNIFVLFS